HSPGRASERKRLRERRPLGQRLRLPLMLIAPIVVVAGAGYFYLTGGRYESTDDAYVQAARVSVSSNVSGRVIELDVHDNQSVKRTAVLLRLDDAPFRIAVEESSAQLAAARLQIGSLKATYRQREADLRSVQDTLAY